MTQAIADVHALSKAFNEIAADLLAATRASRTTIRIDLPSAGFDVENPAAEARAEDKVRSLLGQPALNQRNLDTVRWLEEHRRCLIQNSCRDADPAPPQALMDIYGVKAQMLGPIERNGDLIAWVSVHENREVRDWSAHEVSALEQALARVNATLDAYAF